MQADEINISKRKQLQKEKPNNLKKAIVRIENTKLNKINKNIS